MFNICFPYLHEVHIYQLILVNTMCVGVCVLDDKILYHEF